MSNGRYFPPYVPKTREECCGANGLLKKKLYGKPGGGKLYMTPRQRDVYLFIKYFWDEYGYSPTHVEIANGLNLKSKSNVARIIHRLVEMRLVYRDGARRRTVRRLRYLDREQDV